MTSAEIAAGLYAWPDVEVCAVTELVSIAPTYTETPPELERAIRVFRTGGSDDGITDYPVVEITCYGAGDQPRADAWALAGQVREHLLAARGHLFGGALCDDVRTATPPAQIPELNPEIRSVTHSYVLAFRRRRVSP
jgi:hypothetical protein